MARVSDLRVLHVINKISPSGGAEVSLTQMIPALAARGVDQAVVTLLPSTAGHVLQRLQHHGVELFDTHGADVTTSTRGVRAAIQSFRPSVISSSLYEANRAARLSGAATATPVLCGLVNTPYDAQARRAAAAGWKLAAVAQLEGVLARRLTSHFHALTQATADSAVRHLGIDPSSVTVVPRGRDRSALGEPGPARRTSVRQSMAIPDDAFVVLNVGRQEHQKAQVLLVEAFEVLAREQSTARLLIAGRPGAASAVLESRVAASAFADRITLLGLRDDVSDLLAAADLFVFSSLWEGLGGAVLEAMAMGVPVASFAVPAVTEVLDGCGAVVPLGDATALGRVALRLAQDPVMRQRLSSAARARFEQEYELGAIVPRMESLYLLAAGRPAPGRRSATSERQ